MNLSGWRGLAGIFKNEAPKSPWGSGGGGSGNGGGGSGNGGNGGGPRNPGPSRPTASVRAQARPASMSCSSVRAVVAAFPGFRPAAGCGCW